MEILFAFVKMGKDQRPIDNRTTGGLTANVDIRTGLVTSEGVDKFGQFYERHPDTDIVIKGAQIPKWDELCALVDELARVVPTVKYVGWDLALTPTGWVMIEGNSHGGFTGSQMSSLLGIKKDVEALIARA